MTQSLTNPLHSRSRREEALISGNNSEQIRDSSPRLLHHFARGFTFIELLVVITVIGMLATLFLPVMAKAKGKSMSMSAQCLNNHRQIIAAAIMYADENQDWWPLNMPGANPGWCAGFEDFNPNNPYNTNTAFIMDPRQSVLGPFLPKPQVLHCPADKSFVIGEGPRVRSVSMSAAVGSSATSICGQPTPCLVNGQWLAGVNIGNGCNTSGYRTYGKTSQMTAPVPGSLWVFCDEQPNSINDAQLQMQCAQQGPFATIIDYPASYHNIACSFSFVDGHTELHRWTGQGIQIPVNFSGGVLGGSNNHPANDSATTDVLWLQSHTSAKY